MDVETPCKTRREIVTNVEEETKDLLQEREEQTRGVVSQLTAPCLKSIEKALQDGRCVKVLIIHFKYICVGICMCILCVSDWNIVDLCM